MTKDEALKLALEALGKVTTEMLALKDELAERGARPMTNVFHQRLWDSSFKAYTDHALPAATAIREVLAQQPVSNTDEFKCPYCYDHGVPPPECKTEAEKTAFAFGWWKALEANRAQPEQEPVLTPYRIFAHGVIQRIPQRKPLTDEQLKEITLRIGWMQLTGDDTKFARAIEAAHGIKE